MPCWARAAAEGRARAALRPIIAMVLNIGFFPMARALSEGPLSRSITPRRRRVFAELTGEDRKSFKRRPADDSWTVRRLKVGLAGKRRGPIRRETDCFPCVRSHSALLSAS